MTVSDPFLKATGLKEEGVIGKTIDQIFPEPTLKLVKKKYQQAIQKKKTVRWEETTEYHSGLRVVDVEVTPAFNEDGICSHLIGSVHDITELKLAEQSLRDSREKLLKAQHIARLGFWDWNIKTNEIHWSDEVYNISGVDPEKKPDINMTLGLVHPEDLEFVQKNLEIAIKGTKRYNIDHRIVRQDDITIWIHAQADIVLDTEGKAETLLGTVLDITDRKQAEEELEKHRQNLEKLVNERTLELKDANDKIKKSLNELKQTQTQLVQAEKMASIGLLTAGLAHEINNPLNVVNIGTAGLEKDLKMLLQIMDKYQELEKAPQSTGILKDIAKLKQKIDFEYLMDNIPETLKDIRLGINRSAEIIKSLTNFSRTDTEDQVMTDIHRGLDATHLLLQNKIKDRVTITKDYDGSIEGVLCYPSQLNQVFMNIILNAIQAIRDKGTLTITTRKHKNHLDISIKDSGSGISAENMDKIFDPFFTTKDVGEGTGLGLSISHGIIEKHNGTIVVKSKEGKGSEFVISLPISN